MIVPNLSIQDMQTLVDLIDDTLQDEGKQLRELRAGGYDDDAHGVSEYIASLDRCGEWVKDTMREADYMNG